MAPDEIVAQFFSRMVDEKVVDWTLWVKPPNPVVRWLIGLGKYQRKPPAYQLIAQEEGEAVVAYLNHGEVYKCHLRWVDEGWRILRFGQ